MQEVTASTIRLPGSQESLSEILRRGAQQLRARAIEAGVFVVAAAQSGHHEDGRDTYGHSLLVGPWGEIMIDMGEQVGVGLTDVDLGEIETVRQRVPAIAHRRPIGEPSEP